MKKVAIDLTWVRPNKVGGTESCVRNLLDGFAEINDDEIKFVLLLSKDNIKTFEKYIKYSCFKLVECQVYSENQIKRVLWQNLKMGSFLRKNRISVCLEPVYGKPFLGCKNIKFITTIHDLQALHYPQYFNKARVFWMKASWRNALKTSMKVIAISNFVKRDIIKNYNINKNKIIVVYDAVVMNLDSSASIEKLNDYKVKKGDYYYTVSSLFLHKNLKTAILALAELKRRNSKAFKKLIVSGIGGRKRDELDKLIIANDLCRDVIFTSFVSNEERNLLYKNCKAFIFTSVFEGFGMPPIEAMALGVPVLTNQSTSIFEVTDGLCNYVSNPLDPLELADALEKELIVPNKEKIRNLLQKYNKERIASKYLSIIKRID